MNKVYVKKSGIAGKGVFAKQNIKRGKIIFRIKGEVVKKDSYGPNYKFGPRWIAIGNCVWINTKRNSPCWFINHSCQPNAGLKSRKTIAAMRNIKKDEEITIDYSTTEDDPYWKMKCGCEEKNCRKIIRSVRFLNKKLFRKYKPFIPKWLQESYCKHNLNYVPKI